MDQAVTLTGLHWHVMNVTVIEDARGKGVQLVMWCPATLIEALHIDENWGSRKRVMALSSLGVSIVTKVERSWADYRAPLW